MSRGLERKILDDKSTVNTYADSEIVEFLNYVRALFWIKNTGTKSLDYKIFGSASIADSDAGWDEVLAETTLTSGSKGKHTITDAWAKLKIQVKSTLADNPTTVDAFIVKKRY